MKALRIENNWTQDELGEKLNVKRAAISKYECNKIPLTDETLIRLSQIFNVSIDYIFEISDYKHSTPVDPKANGEDKKHCSKSKSDTLTDIINNLSPESKKELEKYIQFLELKDSTYKSTSDMSSASK